MRRSGLLCLIALAGCTSSDPRLFALEPQPGQVWAGSAGVVVVRRVPVPPYLDRDEIVQYTGKGRVHNAANDWWSERLGTMVQRVLAAELVQRLPGTTVLGTEALGGERATVALAVSRFEPAEGGAVALDGTLAIEVAGRPRVLLPVAVRVRLDATRTDAQVLAMSSALAEVADRVATVLGNRDGCCGQAGQQ